ncbi:TPA: hypothetical protein QCR36_003898 [Bacillus cereus]|nr:hypothetical protein [Bacillus cereus]HDR4742373.1 hypothetical protein [Bacillus cereus]HDR4747960.1 hypothetical protein [Bacillus cereus]HDR4753434.1 hypothetical protein [Bacillus cereus]HDR4770643.1 hypothetical protein [Bacillus cereus]
MTNLYDLVLEYDRETKVITKRIEIPWRYEYDFNQNPMVQDWQMPSYPEQVYDEYANQFVPHVRLGASYTNLSGNKLQRGTYQGDLSTIKVGDLITQEMLDGHYLVGAASPRSQHYDIDKTQATLHGVTGTQFDIVRYLASARFYWHATDQHVEDAFAKGLITEEDRINILSVHKSAYH